MYPCCTRTLKIDGYYRKAKSEDCVHFGWKPQDLDQVSSREGITVVHVVSSVKFALKAQEAGVDAVVAEGFEAGGHNGRDETTTMVLIPSVKEKYIFP